jgi:hypothetical protein
MWQIFQYDQASFEKFLYENNILATTAGVLIAYSARDVIVSLVGDITLPAIYFIFVQRYFSSKFVSKVFEPVNKLDLPKFFSTLISFIIVLLITYLTIQYIISTLKLRTGSPTPEATPDKNRNAPSRQT